MNRPYVNLKSENALREMLDALDKQLDMFKALDGLVGITLNGGLSRGYGDALSEIDVVLYLPERQFAEYEKGRYPFALGITVIAGKLYDIKAVCYERELARDFEPVALWDLSYAKILHDPEGRIAELIKQKLAPGVDIAQAGELLWSAYWSYKLAGDIWIHRQDGLQGHLMFNDAILPLISALFIANREYIPHEKWLVHMSRSLAWKPAEWEARLVGAMQTGDFSVRSLKSRQAYIAGLWQEISDRLCEMAGFQGRLDFTRKDGYETLVRLIEKDEYSIAEWEAVSSLEALNYEPMHSIFRRVGDAVVLDREGLLALRPEDMYVWLYETADEARKAYLRG